MGVKMHRVISRLIKQPLDDAMIALVLLTRSHRSRALIPSSPARAPLLHDNILNLPVVARQPHPDPNFVSHTAARRVAGA